MARRGLGSSSDFGALGQMVILRNPVGRRQGLPGLALGGALAFLTLCPAPAWAFRSAGDDSAFRGSEKVRWALVEVPYTVHSDAPPGLSSAEVQSVSQQALGRWNKAVSGQLVFRFEGSTSEAASRGDGINTIQFLKAGWEERGFDPTAAGLTDISYVKDPTGRWVIDEADLYLNGEHSNWIVSGEGDDNERALDSVLTHEGGHMVGLWHPCENGGAHGAPDCSSDPDFAETAMYPVYSATQSRLSGDDIAGADYLYGVESCDVNGCPGSSVCKLSGCVVECGGALCEINEHCTPDGCWRDGDCYGLGCDVSCEKDADCEDGQRCFLQQCGGATSVGDACIDSIECESGLCAKDGFCVGSCADCEEGTCGLRSDGSATCRALRKPFGAPCDAAEDCFDGQCLVGTRTENVCTRDCSTGDDPAPTGAVSFAGCPQGWACTSVDGSKVCAPEVRPVGGGSCALDSRTVSYTHLTLPTNREV